MAACTHNTRRWLLLVALVTHLSVAGVGDRLACYLACVFEHLQSEHEHGCEDSLCASEQCGEHSCDCLEHEHLTAPALARCADPDRGRELECAASGHAWLPGGWDQSVTPGSNWVAARDGPPPRPAARPLYLRHRHLLI